MTNLPPPDPRSSRLGFDELVGVVVAFAVIGTILIVSLRQKDRGFSLGSLLPSLTTPTSPQASPDPTASSIPPQGLPRNLEQVTPSPEPSAVREAIPEEPIPTATPVLPATPVTPQRVSQVPPLVPAPLVVASPAPAETVTPTPARTVNFPDVPQDYWARPYIEALAERGIVAGFQDGKFRPNQPVTRAEFAAQLKEAFDQKAVANPVNYKDVSSTFWASPAIQATTKSGFLRGYPGTVFRPEQQIPKVQALVALTKGLGLASTSSPNQVVKVYQDAAQIPKYVLNPVAAATVAGLVVNYPNSQSLNPNRNTTRAEAAALIYQGLVHAGKVKAIPSKYVVTSSQRQP